MGQRVAEERCPEKVPEISTFITPGSNTNLKRGIRLYGNAKAFGHQLQRKCLEPRVKLKENSIDPCTDFPPSQISSEPHYSSG